MLDICALTRGVQTNQRCSTLETLLLAAHTDPWPTSRLASCSMGTYRWLMGQFRSTTCSVEWLKGVLMGGPVPHDLLSMQQGLLLLLWTELMLSQMISIIFQRQPQ